MKGNVSSFTHKCTHVSITLSGTHSHYMFILILVETSMKAVRRSTKDDIAEKKRKKRERILALRAEAEKEVAIENPVLVAKMQSNREKADQKKAANEERKKREKAAADEERKKREKAAADEEWKKREQKLENKKQQLTEEEIARRIETAFSSSHAVGPNDILPPHCIKWPGNIHFQRIIEPLKSVYQSKQSHEQSAIVDLVMSKLTNEGRRFFTKVGKDIYHKLDADAAKERCIQALKG